MDNGNKRWNWGWVSSVILIIVYIIVVTSFVVASDNNTNRNTVEIEKQYRIHREDMQRMEDIILEGFKELRREINSIK